MTTVSDIRQPIRPLPVLIQESRTMVINSSPLGLPNYQLLSVDAARSRIASAQDCSLLPVILYCRSPHSASRRISVAVDQFV